MKIAYILAIIFCISVTSASQFSYNKLDNQQTIISGANYSINVNNTNYHQGLTPQQVANLFDASGYYLKSNPFSFYNSTTIPAQTNYNSSGLIINWSNTISWNTLLNKPAWIDAVNASYIASNCTTESAYNWSVSTPYSPNATIIPNIDNSLVSWWRMDDTNSSGTRVVDYMGRNNGSAINGAAQVTNGKFGKAWGFDGVDDWVKVSNFPAQNTNDTTISAWVYVNGRGDNYVLQFGGSNRNILINSVNEPQFSFLNASSCASGTALNNNQWYNLVGVRNGSQLNVYINGNLSKVCSSPIANLPAQNDIGIGASYNGGSARFNGSIDDVMIFNRSLSADEILSLYNATAYNHQSPINYTGNVYIQNSTADVNITDGNKQGTFTTTCYGGSTVNNTLDFGNVTVLANNFAVHSSLYSGDALSLIGNLKTKDTKSKYEDVDYSKSGDLKVGDLSFSTILKAIQQLITKNNEQDVLILENKNEIKKIKDCAKLEDFKAYKECLIK
jgi:hypothetical protein